MTLPALPYPDADLLADHWWWRPGWQVGTRFYAWHVTLTDLPALRGLVRCYQAALADFGVLDVIPERWLHITLQGLGHTRDVPDAERDAVIDAVQGRLQAIWSPTLTFGRPVLHREAVVIPPTEAEPLRALRTALRRGIADVLGRRGVPDAGLPFQPHVSVAYVNAPADPAPLRAALDAVGDRRAEAAIGAVTLIEMHRDRRMYEWREVASCRLGPVSSADS
jgi:2'-5' RNA ligase